MGTRIAELGHAPEPPIGRVKNGKVTWRRPCDDLRPSEPAVTRFLNSYRAGWNVTWRLLGVALVANFYTAPLRILLDLLPDDPQGRFVGTVFVLLWLSMLPLVLLFAVRSVGLRQETLVEAEAAHRQVIDLPSKH